MGSVPDRTYRRVAPAGVRCCLLSGNVYLGEEHNGLYRIASNKSDGWVDKLLVRAR